MSFGREFEISIESCPFDFGLTASLFARFPSEIVDLFADGTYRRVLDLRGRPILAEVSATGDADARSVLQVSLADEAVPDEDVVSAEKQLRHIFDLDFPLAGFYSLAGRDPVLAPLVERYCGLRMLVRPSLFEALVMNITTQQINLTFAYALKARLVRAFGRTLQYDGQIYYAFPTAPDLAAATVPELRQMQYSERKADYIIGLAGKVTSGELDLEALGRLPDEEFTADIIKLRGLGRWSAEWALARGLGRPDVVAADDIGVQRAFSRYCCGGRPVNAPQVRAIAERWRPYRSYAVHYLLIALYHRLEPWHEIEPPCP